MSRRQHLLWLFLPAALALLPYLPAVAPQLSMPFTNLALEYNRQCDGSTSSVHLVLLLVLVLDRCRGSEYEYEYRFTEYEYECRLTPARSLFSQR